MSTEHDETRPVPTTPPTAPMPQTGRTPGPADDATTPIPRPGAGRTAEPTVVFDTLAPEPAGGATAPTRAIGADGPAHGPTGTTTPTAPVSLGKPAAEPGTARTSAFAAAGAPDRGIGSGAGESGAGESGSGGSGSRTTSPPAGYGAPASGPAGPPAGYGPGGTPSPAGPPDGYGSGGVTTAPAPAPAADVAAEREVSTTLRVGTVVWGLVLAIIGAGLIAIAAGAEFDLELAAIGLLALAGIALVIGSVVGAARRKR